jgi:hypothetical protein
MGVMLKKPEGEAGKSGPAIAIGLFVAFGGILYGYAFSYSNSPHIFLTTFQLRHRLN